MADDRNKYRPGSTYAPAPQPRRLTLEGIPPEILAQVLPGLANLPQAQGGNPFQQLSPPLGRYAPPSREELSPPLGRAEPLPQGPSPPLGRATIPAMPHPYGFDARGLLEWFPDDYSGPGGLMPTVPPVDRNPTRPPDWNPADAIQLLKLMGFGRGR